MSKNKTKKRRHPFLVFYALFVAATVLLAAWFYLPIDSFIARHDAERKGYTVASQPEELDYKYYYNHLKSKSEQEAYTLICSQLPDFPERIAVPNLSSDEVQEVYTAVSYDNPEFFFLGNSCQYMRFGAVFYFQPTYSMTKEQYIAQMDAVESEANALIANLDAGASDYDKELYIQFYDFRNHKTYVPIRMTNDGVSMTYDEHGHPELGKISKAVLFNDILEKKFKAIGLKVKTRPVEIGYDVRCQDPIAFDLTYCSELAMGAYELFKKGETGCMVYVDAFGEAKPLYLKDLQGADGKIPPRRVAIDGGIAQNYFNHLCHFITPADYEAAKKYVPNPEAYDFRKILNW